MNTHELLKQFDLDGKKANVYLAILELGSAGATDIAKKATIKRTTAYDILLELQKNGLVYETRKGKKRLFVAENPNKLRKNLEEKNRILEELLPELQYLHNAQGTKPQIRFYEGKNGLKDVYDDTLNYAGELLILASDDTVKTLGTDWAQNYLKKRVKKNIRARAILPETELIKSDFVANDQQHLRMSKLIDPKKYPFSTEINIYGHKKVALISAKEEMGVIIEGTEIHKTLKLIFQLLWDTLPEIKIK